LTVILCTRSKSEVCRQTGCVSHGWRRIKGEVSVSEMASELSKLHPLLAHNIYILLLYTTRYTVYVHSALKLLIISAKKSKCFYVHHYLLFTTMHTQEHKS